MKWTIDEEDILIDNFSKCSYKELSVLVNKSEGSIKGKLERMRLVHRKLLKWTADEDGYMADNYGTLPPRVIASVLGRSVDSVTMRAVVLNITNKYHYRDFIPNYNIGFFRKWSSDLAWLVGVVLSDGHVSNTKLSSKYVRIKMCDSDVIYKIKDMLNFRGNINVFTSPNGYKTSYSITIGGREVWNFFTYLGMNSDKSHNATLPSHVPIDFLSHLIRGVFDGDGSITIASKKYISCRICGTESIISSIRDLIGIHSTIHSNKTRTNFIVQYTGDRALEFMKYIYDGAIKGNSMDRKYNIYKSFVN